MDPSVQTALRLGDTCLVLAQRLSEWCGHAPAIEEDIALANIALDILGQARGLLTRAGELEGDGRDEDALAYWRAPEDFRNLQLVELPNGDFARTILRQFFYDAYAVELWSRLTASTDPGLAGVAAKADKESRYHLRHSSGWVVRLGDGTDESHRRIQEALAQLWPYAGEAFIDDDADRAAAELGLAPLPSDLLPNFSERLTSVFTSASLPVPEPVPWQRGGRQGRHTEHLSYLLAEMQVVARAHPGAVW